MLTCVPFCCSNSSTRFITINCESCMFGDDSINMFFKYCTSTTINTCINQVGTYISMHAHVWMARVLYKTQNRQKSTYIVYIPVFCSRLSIIECARSSRYMSQFMLLPLFRLWSCVRSVKVSRLSRHGIRSMTECHDLAASKILY